MGEKDNAGNITDYLYDGRLYEGIIPQGSGGRFRESLSGTSVVGGVYGQDFDMGDADSVTGSVYGAGSGSQWPEFGPWNPGGWWSNPWVVPGGRIFYRQDGLGSVSAISDINGRVLNHTTHLANPGSKGSAFRIRSCSPGNCTIRLTACCTCGRGITIRRLAGSLARIASSAR